jgi:hypothetical protein
MYAGCQNLAFLAGKARNAGRHLIWTEKPWHSFGHEVHLLLLTAVTALAGLLYEPPPCEAAVLDHFDLGPKWKGKGGTFDFVKSSPTLLSRFCGPYEYPQRHGNQTCFGSGGVANTRARTLCRTPNLQLSEGEPGAFDCLGFLEDTATKTQLAGLYPPVLRLHRRSPLTCRVCHDSRTIPLNNHAS